MTVKELIEKLNGLPKNAEVFHLWDGALRTAINVVYESKGGDVVTSDYEQVCYKSESRPKEAPNSDDDRYWETERGPKEDWED